MKDKEIKISKNGIYFNFREESLQATSFFGYRCQQRQQRRKEKKIEKLKAREVNEEIIRLLVEDEVVEGKDLNQRSENVTSHEKAILVVKSMGT